ncbi:dipeptide ABC transporter ATP-binding protein [Pseudodesulfovibrio sp. F-1]|uniref:Dipeptide ABC transporter ATP-binding protein n=1 Tax=Pseudodesulfovibrio alkaliphilus TaxID=2661613 RepID=A0A7K1KL28_9BACT|nr:dipeptide ABC transporter ATP-binding protein [Pseudodesulfovibrio alkaliphilus]MUM76740.1 dipeptide ABC transporter ATP-binding protein [Pseudodesulfovibrio alkaliphilus]
MMDSLLEIRGLCVSFTGQPQKSPAVRGLDLSLEKGQCLALVGESGSGKSVTAQAVMGLLPSGSTRVTGSVHLAGTDMISAPPEMVRAMRGNRVGMIFQEPQSALNPLHCVEKQIGETLKAHGRVSAAQARRRTQELLELVRIDPSESRLKAYPHQLSGGQRQRVMIAMALANNPDLLIADEPTTSLDMTVQARILDLISSLRCELGMAVLLITHDLRTVRDHADRVAVMHQGALVEEGSTSGIFSGGKHEYTRMLLDTTLPTEPPPAATGPCLLATRKLTVDFGLPGKMDLRNGKLWTKRRFRAVNEVDLTVFEGRNHAIVGESGSGKTTFAEAVLGFVRFSGKVEFSGRDLAVLNRKEVLSVRRCLQPVFQDPFASLNPRMTIGQIVSEGLRVHGSPSRDGLDAAKAMLKEVGIHADAVDRYPHEFSGGQRQRIAIARALVMRPRLMILDEPTSALDKPVQTMMVDLLAQLGARHGVTYVFITHDLGLVRSLCHEMTVLRDGSVVEQGLVSDIFYAPENAYTKRLLASAHL